MRRVVIALAACAALGATGVAQGGTVTFTKSLGIIRYDADPGETNRVFVVTDLEGLHVLDLGAAVSAGAGCSSPAPNEGFCASTPEQLALYRVEVFAGDEDDYVDFSGGEYGLGLLVGGSGEDLLIGGFARAGNTYDGGSGADVFKGRGTVDYSSRTNPVTVTLGDDLANDGEAGENDLVPRTIGTVLGGEGADTLTADRGPHDRTTSNLIGGDGNDRLTVTGGRTIDRLIGEGGADVLRAPGRNDFMDGGTGKDVLTGGDLTQALWGGRGDDVLRGLDGKDRLIGQGGDDVLRPGSGKDSVSASHGDDTIYGRDGWRDVFDGGPGFDRARVDAGLDRLVSIEERF
jgi:Ca2+-binding RTX toxin-like protein